MLVAKNAQLVALEAEQQAQLSEFRNQLEQGVKVQQKVMVVQNVKVETEESGNNDQLYVVYTLLQNLVNGEELNQEGITKAQAQNLTEITSLLQQLQIELHRTKE